MLNNKQEYLDKNIFIHDLLYYIVQIFCSGILCLHNGHYTGEQCGPWAFISLLEK